MLRLVFSALVASALVLIPATLSTQYSDQARAEAAAEKADKGKAAKRSKREQTKGQKAFRERQKRCSVEWREGKKSGKIAKGETWQKTWRKFFSECNTRLKAEKS